MIALLRSPFCNRDGKQREPILNADVISFLASLTKRIDYSMLSEAEWRQLAQTDVSTGHGIARLIDEFVIPEYQSWDDSSRKLIRVALESALDSHDFDFSDVFAKIELPFVELPEPRRFFQAIRTATLATS